METAQFDPEKLKPELHQKIEHLTLEHLKLLHSIVLKLELDQTVDDLHEAFDEARSKGKLERADQLIREARARTPYE
jgi:hypothetical protein